MEIPPKALTSEELGTIEVVLMEFNHNQLPRLMDIKKRVDQGDQLGEYDIVFLKESLNEVRACEHFADSHPSYQDLISRVADLYKHITQKATENQVNRKS